MIKPIPKRLLKHQAIYKKYKGNGGDGPVYENEVTLQYVRFEDKKQKFRSFDGNEVIANALMFYDLTNSVGFDVKPVVGGKITYEGHEYEIADVEVLTADKVTAHHYEVLLK